MKVSFLEVATARARRWPKLSRLVFAATAALALLVTAAVVTDGFGVPSGRATAQTHRVVILTDGSHWPLGDSTLESRGAVAVRSWSELLKNVDSTTKAIVVTNDTISFADGDWVKERVAAGVVLGGLGVSTDALKSWLGLPTLPPTAPEEYVPPVLDGSAFKGDPYFGLFYQVTTPTHGSEGGMTERFLSTEQFLFNVERYIERVQFKLDLGTGEGPRDGE